MTGPDILLMKIVETLPPHEAGNRLMRVSDREIAIAALYMEKGHINKLLSLLSPQKNKRVRQEIAYVERLYIKYPLYKTVMEELILKIGGTKTGSTKSYIRPRKDY